MLTALKKLSTSPSPFHTFYILPSMVWNNNIVKSPIASSSKATAKPSLLLTTNDLILSRIIITCP